MCELAEADTAEIEISHIASFARTQLTASYDAASILRGTRSAYCD